MMIEKLLNLNVNTHITAWVLNFLTEREQYVRVNNTLSLNKTINTGAPQGCVLSPSLYTIYTNDYQSKHTSVNALKFADDTAILGLIQTSEKDYFEEIEHFVKWCTENYLTLNVKKTKEIIIDFRILKEPITNLQIHGEVVEILNSYKYLGLTLDNKINWHSYIEVLCKKIHKRLFLLKKLRSFNVSKKILINFYRAIIESVINFGINCWGGSITASDKYKINKLIKRSEGIIGERQDKIEDIYNKVSIKKAKQILDDITHPLYKEYLKSGRSGRYLTVKTKTERLRNSFIPITSKMLSACKL